FLMCLMERRTQKPPTLRCSVVSNSPELTGALLNTAHPCLQSSMKTFISGKYERFIHSNRRLSLRSLGPQIRSTSFIEYKTPHSSVRFEDLLKRQVRISTDRSELRSHAGSGSAPTVKSNKKILEHHKNLFKKILKNIVDDVCWF